MNAWNRERRLRDIGRENDATRSLRIEDAFLLLDWLSRKEHVNLTAIAQPSAEIVRAFTNRSLT